MPLEPAGQAAAEEEAPREEEEQGAGGPGQEEGQEEALDAPGQHPADRVGLMISTIDWFPMCDYRSDRAIVQCMSLDLLTSRLAMYALFSYGVVRRSVSLCCSPNDAAPASAAAWLVTS